MSEVMQEALGLLRTHYGYEAFREGQGQLIESILGGRDTLGIMPTGGGKSICYQIPALLFPGTTLVISPLISLMKDQVDALLSHGIPATYINSSLDVSEVEDRLRRTAAGEYKLLYVAPERLESDRFVSLLQMVPIGLLAVDEAHCLSQWGHDFRPSYLAVSKLLQFLPERPVVAAFTATATPEVTADIERLLGLREAFVHVTGFDRANLKFVVLKSDSKRDDLLHHLERYAGQAGVVYAATRKEVDQLTEFLRSRGYAVGRYHAGLSDEERAEAQEMFLYDDIRVMVATNAFGMGIDKSNVRFVIHYNMPKNMEAYYQEAGRAGRDGEPGECILLYSPQDVQVQKFLIEQGLGDPERKLHDYRKLQAMSDYCHTSRCLRRFILEYFEDHRRQEDCGNCSNCCGDEEREERDVTLDAQKIFSCVKRMRERFGVNLVAQVLKGSKNKKVLQFGLQDLPTYGLMEDRTEKELSDLMHILVAEGFLALSEGQYPVVRLTPRVVPVLQGQEPVVVKVRKRKQTAVSTSGAASALSGAAAALFDRLRELRKELSQKHRVPPYIIFPDSSLREMAEQVPTDEVAMLRIKGIGEGKMRTYGWEFLDLIKTYAEEHDIQPSVSLVETPTTSVAKKSGEEETPSHVQTYLLYKDGWSPDDIASRRGLKPITVQDHLVRAAQEGHEVDWDAFIPDGYEPLIVTAIERVGAEKLKPLKDALPPEVDYFAIKAVLCKLSLS